MKFLTATIMCFLLILACEQLPNGAGKAYTFPVSEQDCENARQNLAQLNDLQNKCMVQRQAAYCPQFQKLTKQTATFKATLEKCKELNQKPAQPVEKPAQQTRTGKTELCMQYEKQRDAANAELATANNNCYKLRQSSACRTLKQTETSAKKLTELAKAECAKEVPAEYLKPIPTPPVETPLPIQPCTDSDGGKNYEAKGTTTGLQPENLQFGENTDYCEGEYLYEGYCNYLDRIKEYARAIDVYKCPNGCGNGVCLPFPYIPEVKEEVKCVFKGSTQTEECYVSEGSLGGGCSGISTCATEIIGNMNAKVTWKSSCGGYAYTTMDGNAELAEFDCQKTPTTVQDMVTCVFQGATNMESCYSPEIGGGCGYHLGSCEGGYWGILGQKVTWRSTCGGSGETTMDGQPDRVVFNCANPTEKNTCTDTDGGMKPDMAGEITGKNLYDSSTNTRKDICWADTQGEVTECKTNCKVQEQLCTSAGYIEMRYLECTDGCKNGACIKPNTPPTITSTPTNSVQTGSTYSYVVQAIDADGPNALTYAFEAGGQPSGAYFSGNKIIWTPSQTGRFYFAITVSDGKDSTGQMWYVQASAPAPKLSGTCGPCTTDANCDPSASLCYSGKCIRPGSQGPGAPTTTEAGSNYQKFAKPLTNAQYYMSCAGYYNVYNGWVKGFYRGALVFSNGMNCGTWGGTINAGTGTVWFDSISWGNLQAGVTSAEWSPC